MSGKIGGFHIRRRLGNQSKRKFGEVFLLESDSGEKAVLKLLRKIPGSEKIAMRIRQEATFSFDAAGLPEVIDFTETDEQIALILRYREGVPLSEWMPRKRAGKVADLLFALSEPLRKIHDAGIIHLDLKPDNLLIQASGDRLNVSVIDFGMAMKTGNGELRSTLFSLPYAAPELVLNRLDLVDFRTDYFSAGSIIYQFLEQKLPFRQNNPSVYTNLQLVHPIPRISCISTKQNELLQKLTAKPEFRTAPNLLSTEEQTAKLVEAIKKRPLSLEEVSKEWKEAASASWMQKIFRQ